jgi:hypothetical protein
MMPENTYINKRIRLMLMPEYSALCQRWKWRRAPYAHLWFSSQPREPAPGNPFAPRNPYAQEADFYDPTRI